MQSLALNNFCFKLFNSLSLGKDENFFISPFSISTALTMAYAGSRAQTATQLKQLLNLNEQLTNDQIFKTNGEYFRVLAEIRGQVELNVANKIFIANDFQLLEEFSKILADSFKSSVQTLDYSRGLEAARAINSFVEKQTVNKIKNLVSPSDLDSLTKLVLVNAIYFKGNWKHQFEKCQTHKDEFYIRNGSTKETEYMSLANKMFQFSNNPEGLKADVCQFLYEGDQVAMTVILPNEGVYIEEVEKQLSADLLRNVLEKPTIETKVLVYLPKFKLEFKTELADALIKLGAPDAFDSMKADFSGISDSSDLFISKVIHQAVVEVNEEGTEAAAATSVIMQKRCMVMVEEFRCNRPFIFLIHEKKSNGILFIGKFMKPE